ncbi:glycerol-3-phosphate acyltransferase 9 [Euphorbia peplus]|nr:glycerol-3-phosphate acyltransferase 9 [Euphorbia peplus]
MSGAGELKSSSSELDLDRPNIEDYLPSGISIQEPHGKLRLRDLLDISPTLTEAAGAIVDDSFTRCFKSNPPEPWNWNIYLFPLWCCGVVFRYGILFPLRALVLTIGWIIFLSSYIPVHLLLKGHDKLRKKLERCLVELICSFFVASWTGVVKYHGPRPSIRPKQVFVANHTSMIDFIILEQMTAFAVIMQKHPGWVGLLQSTILESVGCIWFNRSEAKDREIVAKKLRDHVQGADNNPLLIFPEGTCVNNHYTVMFKKGAFELGSTVCPIAIKYNKIFVDAFWNSRKQSFTTHLLQLMTSWAVVCDVWYLEPQNLKPGETPIEFAERVRDIISVRAGLKKVPWDGYLKYSRPSPKHKERKQQSFAESVLRRLEDEKKIKWATGIQMQGKRELQISSANNLPSSTPSNYTFQALQIVNIPIPCRCSNGSGVSDGVPIYRVQPDDGLFYIANNVYMGLVTYQQIQEANNIPDPDLILAGQKLWIPLPCSCDSAIQTAHLSIHYAHVVEGGSTVESIANQFGTSSDVLYQLNGIANNSQLIAQTPFDVPLKG